MIDNVYAVMPYAMNVFIVVVGIAVLMAVLMMVVRGIRG
jgi:predicted tellurium resistance membrane protein TerC